MITGARRYFFILIAGLGLVFFQNCGPNDGTDTGDPSVQLELSSYSTQASWVDAFIPKAFANVNSVSMCIYQIRFKPTSSTGNQGLNIIFDVNDVQWSPSGTSLGTIQIPEGEYDRVDIMVKDDCGENLSILIQNDNGQFSNDSPLTLRFRGLIEVNSSTDVITLGVAPFILFFDSIDSNADLNAGVQNIDGSL